MNMFADFSLIQIILSGLLFTWAGFVRSGLGFGGAALGLPLMLFVYDQPLYWLPMIGIHLLFFSALTLRTRLNNVNWGYLKQASLFVIPGALIGVFGLISLPTLWLVVFIYSITLFYAIIWILNISLHSNNSWWDRFLLITGGYVAGISLSGAPIMVAVFMRNISASQLRNTMFVLWFILVSIKLATLAAFGIRLHVVNAVLLLPVAAIGHVIGLKLHELILQNDRRFKQAVGVVLCVICLSGLYNAIHAT